MRQSHKIMKVPRPQLVDLENGTLLGVRGIVSSSEPCGRSETWCFIPKFLLLPLYRLITKSRTDTCCCLWQVRRCRNGIERGQIDRRDLTCHIKESLSSSSSFSKLEPRKKVVFYSPDRDLFDLNRFGHSARKRQGKVLFCFVCFSLSSSKRAKGRRSKEENKTLDTQIDR